jgi:hypothetical protein
MEVEMSPRRSKFILYNLLIIFAVAAGITITCGIIGPFYPDDFKTPEMIAITDNLTVLIGPGWIPEWRSGLPVVELKPYEIGKYEVSNMEYLQFVEAGGYNESKYWSIDGWAARIDSNWTEPMYWRNGYSSDPYSNKGNTPVHGVSYYEAEAYCNWLSAVTGRKYSIPTSAQWERAAKGPDPGTPYPWGMEFVDGRANYFQFGTKVLQPVNSYPEGKSQAGCFNMIGNVWEFASHLTNNNWIAIYAYSYMYRTTPDGIKRTTTAIHIPAPFEDRWRGSGIRVCRDYIK